jgi:3-oxoacyl-[acyl-carrier protein] reductase
MRDKWEVVGAAALSQPRPEAPRRGALQLNQPTKWAVVTGSSSGIGRATALRLGEEGWNVVVHYRGNRTGAEEAAAAIRNLGRESRIVAADLAARGAAEQLVDETWAQTGGFDAWVHLAGADTLTGANAKLSFAEKLELLTKVDLWATMLACREAGTRMKERGRGTVVMVGWDQAETGMEGDSGELFGAVKAGVAAFGRSLALSLAPTVTVNIVAPGWIKTVWGEGASNVWQERVLRETPLKRWGTPEDVADAVAFLVSDRAAFLTGQTLAVNGGVTRG